MIASADRPAKGGSVRLSAMALSQTEEQCSLMRNLGTLAVAVPEIRTLSKDQFLPAPTSTGGEGAFPLCVDGGQTRGSVTRGSGNRGHALAF